MRSKIASPISRILCAGFQGNHDEERGLVRYDYDRRDIAMVRDSLKDHYPKVAERVEQAQFELVPDWEQCFPIGILLRPK